MKLEIVKVGYLKCNCYILSIDNEALVIDPGDEAKKILKHIGPKKVVGIIITHHHFDHVGALDELATKLEAKVYDKTNLPEGQNKIGKFDFEVIYTPGHKEDLITIYFKDNKWMFCGDFIFKDDIGRCDLPGGNLSDMMKSIKKIREYPKDIIIYPGHDEETSLGYEINNNPYFKEYL